MLLKQHQPEQQNASLIYKINQTNKQTNKPKTKQNQKKNKNKTKKKKLYHYAKLKDHPRIFQFTIRMGFV